MDVKTRVEYGIEIRRIKGNGAWVHLRGVGVLDTLDKAKSRLRKRAAMIFGAGMETRIVERRATTTLTEWREVAR